MAFIAVLLALNTGYFAHFIGCMQVQPQQLEFVEQYFADENVTDGSIAQGSDTIFYVKDPATIRLKTKTKEFVFVKNTETGSWAVEPGQAVPVYWKTRKLLKGL
jgi:hypothetical protein